jgi:DNA polymerase-3 subunit epsilon
MPNDLTDLFFLLPYKFFSSQHDSFMKLQLKRPLIIFDLETTGINIQNDRIVELAYIKLNPDGTSQESTMRFNPQIPIPKEVSAIHGIYDDDIKDAPIFKDKAAALATLFEGCDFGGFNSNKFDFPMLVEEFLRSAIPFETENRKFVDAQRIFHQMEQRTLVAAYKFYCNKNLDNAHSALADARATLEVLMAQLERYTELKNDIDFLHEFSGQSRNVDLAGRVVLNEQKQPVFNFGKHRNKKVVDVFKVEPSYYKWMMEGDFSLDTKRKLTNIYLQSKQQ